MLLIYVGLAVVLWLIVKALQQPKRKLPAELPPGPKGWPVIGNLTQVDFEKMHVTLNQWYKKYGDVVYFRILNKTFVSLNSAEAVKESLVKQAENFSYRPDFWMFSYMSGGCASTSSQTLVTYQSANTAGIPEGLVITDGQKWREHRRFALHVLRDFGMGKTLLEESITEEINDLFSVYEGKMVNGEADMDVVPQLRCAILNIIYMILFKKRFDQEDPFVNQLQNMIRESNEASLSLFVPEFLPFLRPFGFLFGKKKMDTMIDWLLSTMGREIDHHEKNLHQQAEASDFTYAYLMEMEKLRKEGTLEQSTLNRKTLTFSLGDIFFAGHETTATTLAWWLDFMVNYPEIQVKMRQEIEEQIGSTPTWSDRNKLPYCQAVIAETQRHANIIPTGMFHRAHDDTTVMGYAVPNDATVIVNHWSVMRDNKAFADAEQFKPERFLTEEGKFTEKLDGFIPFSVGKRQCLGKGMAEMELFLIATSMLMRYDVTPSKSDGIPSLKPVTAFTRSPPEFKVTLKLRS